MYNSTPIIDKFDFVSTLFPKKVLNLFSRYVHDDFYLAHWILQLRNLEFEKETNGNKQKKHVLDFLNWKLVNCGSHKL